MNGWKFYYPEDGETKEDSRTFKSFGRMPYITAEDVAQQACEYDYDERDGSRRNPIDEPFKIIVVGVDEMEIVFRAHHEPTISHQVSEI